MCEQRGNFKAGVAARPEGEGHHGISGVSRKQWLRHLVARVAIGSRLPYSSRLLRQRDVPRGRRFGAGRGRTAARQDLRGGFVVFLARSHILRPLNTLGAVQLLVIV